MIVDKNLESKIHNVVMQSAKFSCEMEAFVQQESH